VDRDSSIVSKVYDESNEAVKDSIRKIIAIGKKNKVKVGFCGQAPSDSMPFARFLVESGIDSISLNPDTVVKTTVDISKQESGK
jgi:pyruvate,water dikinase